MEYAQSPVFDPLHPLRHVGRKALLGVVLIVIVIVYYTERYAKGMELISTLLKVTPWLVLAMLATNTMYFILQGGLLRGVYRSVGFDRGLLYLTSMYLGMNLVNTIAPMAGLSGSVYMMYFEKHRGLDRGDTFLINFLYYVTDYLVFLAIVLLGIGYLIWAGQSTQVIAATSSIFAGFAIVVLVTGIVLFTHPSALHQLIHGINRILSKLFRRKQPLIKEESVNHFADSALQAWSRSRSGRHHLISSALCALGLHLVSLLMLWLAFQTFHVDVNVQVLVSGYTIATLLNIVSPTPGGIGIAEGGMTAVFVALGIPVEQALLVALLYRTVFIWYPLALGFLALHFLPRLADRERLEVYN